ETQRMNHHVEQVLQMALLEKQGVKVKLKPEDMHELIIDAVHNIELIIGERQGSINTDFKATDYIVPIDKDAMYNVMSNLLDNANKYSPEKLEVNIRTYNKNNNFVFEVQDKGLGMSKDVQSHIFDRFYRANTGNVHNIKGFGLGLNYVKEIITAHNGEIRVKSTINKGSTFIVYLPIKKIKNK
ncbi:MAG TPA: HAMP domain-containing sensor histidine kinase, partial [Bacteroidales bacterium]|nr:HAMP domain-containing sensor histidine kinase [Bacteroidales bacterium]